LINVVFLSVGDRRGEIAGGATKRKYVHKTRKEN